MVLVLKLRSNGVEDPDVLNELTLEKGLDWLIPVGMKYFSFKKGELANKISNILELFKFLVMFSHLIQK